MSFIRQAFDDAQWQRDARAWASRHPDQPRPVLDPTIEMLVPAVEGKMPVAFDASEEREILRALGFAEEFSLDPMIVGGLEASTVIDDLKAANAKVIFSVNYQVGGGRAAAGAAAATHPSA